MRALSNDQKYITTEYGTEGGDEAEEEPVLETREGAHLRLSQVCLHQFSKHQKILILRRFYYHK